MIFVFDEDGTLSVIEGLKDAQREYEGIDVESEVYVFYDENGVNLQPHFIVPNKHGSIFGLFEWRESGTFELKPNSESYEDPIWLALYETRSLNQNPFFKTLDEVKSFLASKGINTEVPPSVVENSMPRDSKDLIIEAKAFFASLNSTTVILNEIVNTDPDPNEDYFVTTELIFEPRSLSECWLTLWFTDCNSVGFGIENSGRLRARLHGLSHWSRASPFVGGREPVSMSRGDLLNIMHSIAAADLVLVVWTIFGKTIGTSLKVSRREYAICEPINRAFARLLAVFGVARKRELTFEPWSNEALSRLR